MSRKDVDKYERLMYRKNLSDEEIDFLKQNADLYRLRLMTRNKMLKKDIDNQLSR